MFFHQVDTLDNPFQKTSAPDLNEACVLLMLTKALAAQAGSDF